MKKVLIFLLTVLTVLFSACSKTQNGAEIIFCDIGKADCSIIKTENNCVIIDSGEKEDFKKINSQLHKNNIKTVDALIITHFDKDHVGGAAQIIENYEVLNVYETSIPNENEYSTEFHEAIEKKNIPLFSSPENGCATDLQFDQMKLRLLYPRETSYKEKEDNNSSIITVLESFGKRVIFFGDAMEERINEFLNFDCVAADLIKAPYHGKFISCYEDLTEKVKFCDAVITSSDKNPESTELLKQFDEMNVKYHLTKFGAIKALINENGIRITKKG